MNGLGEGGGGEGGGEREGNKLPEFKASVVESK